MFTAMFKNPDGRAHVVEATLSVMSNNIRPGAKTRWSANECLVRYDIPENAVWLVPNVGGTWASHPVIAGSSSILSNSQCTVIASGSSAHVAGDIVTINVELKFTASFAGAKQLYISSKDAEGNWSDTQQQAGNFAAVAAQTPR